MKKLLKGFIVVVLILFPFSKHTIIAQTVGIEDTTSLESMLIKARLFAFNKGKAEARTICRQILSKDSTYWDAAVLMGRTYAWDSKYDSARIVLNKIIKYRPGYYDAVDALIDNELLSDNYDKAIICADYALGYHPNDETFLYKKARALNLSGSPKKAIILLDQMLMLNNSNKQAESLRLSIKRDRRVNKINYNYWVNIYDDNSPWIFSSASVGRKTKALGTVTLRYNYARRFDQDGHQYELDAYPRITKWMYMYFNTGFSNKKNFPFTRLTLEPYINLPAGFEMSFGVRYMNFDKKNLFALDSNKVLIYTGTIGKYLGDFWFSVRPYFTPGKDGWSKSVNLTVRKYLQDQESYVSVTVGTGMSPDEQQYAFDPNVKYLKSNKISFDYQQKIAYRFVLSLGAGYSLEEIQTNVLRNRYSVDLGLSFLF